MSKKKSLERKIEILTAQLSSFENKLKKTNAKIDDLAHVIANSILAQKLMDKSKLSEQFNILRAEGEQFSELSELSEQSLKKSDLKDIRGRHREIVVMLINDGFHTYPQISEKLGISQSRARAYISELKNDYNIPLRQFRDSEGYKIGVDMKFVEKLLSPK